MTPKRFAEICGMVLAGLFVLVIVVIVLVALYAAVMKVI